MPQYHIKNTRCKELNHLVLFFFLFLLFEVVEKTRRERESERVYMCGARLWSETQYATIACELSISLKKRRTKRGKKETHTHTHITHTDPTRDRFSWACVRRISRVRPAREFKSATQISIHSYEWKNSTVVAIPLRSNPLRHPFSTCTFYSIDTAAPVIMLKLLKHTQILELQTTVAIRDNNNTGISMRAELSVNWGHLHRSVDNNVRRNAALRGQSNAPRWGIR